jgi:hypothetical protein
MNQEWKAKWIAALRSDNYVQTKGALHDAHGMCCLGVACDVYDPIQWQPLSYGKHRYYRESNYLPSIVINAFELSSENPVVTTDRRTIMTGEQLYNMYAETNEHLNKCSVDPWHELMPEDKAVWADMAQRLQPFKGD